MNPVEKIEFVHEVRAVKNKKEIANIVRAQRISEKVLSEVLLFLKTGVTEQATQNFIKKSFIKNEAPVLSFTPIVAFGKGSADIHHEPSKKTKLKEGDIIMFDFGCTVEHYCSDMTRTFFWRKVSAKQEKVYKSVLEAQARAIKKLEQGERRAKIIDKTARDFLGKKFKNNFKHGLGHGVGTVIHEWPNFKPKSEDILPVGCVMTVEPGIYLRSMGGVRIEDMVLITPKGIVNLTKFPKDFKSSILKSS